MSTDPSEIRAQIEQTRANLSDDVDALAYEANPRTMAHRQVDKVKAKGSRLLDRILGTAEDVRDSTMEKFQHATDAVTGAASDAGDALTNLPRAARTQAQGSPVVAGLVAFGLGLLIAAAIPPTQKEQELAETLKEKAQPLVDEVASAAKVVADDLAQPASEAVDALKDSAMEAVESVKNEGGAAMGDVQNTAKDAGADVSGSAADAVGQIRDEARGTAGQI